MDFYKFINSKDIENHLRKIDYKFNSLEVTWLIYQCRKISLEEKINYWKEIIETMPDYKIPQDNLWNLDDEYKKESLHELLLEYINTLSEEISGFYKKDDLATYVYTIHFFNGWSNSVIIYPSLEAAINTVNADRDEYGEDDIGYYKITKHKLNNENNVVEMLYYPNGKSYDIDCSKSIFLGVWDYFWFDFPTPFEKGDIVSLPNNFENIRFPFVLLNIANWDPIEIKRRKRDTTDMLAVGYSTDNDGNIGYYDGGLTYMDLEYFNNELETNEKILRFLGEYLKERIDIEFLLNIYQRCLLDVAIEKNNLYFCNMNEDYLKQYGIIKEKLEGKNRIIVETKTK